MTEEQHTCQEASPLSVTTYIPCGAPATRLIVTERPYWMCDACAEHNLRNRRAKEWVDPELSRVITFDSVIHPDTKVTRIELSCWRPLVFCSLEQARRIAEREARRKPRVPLLEQPAAREVPADAFSLDNLPEPKR